MARKKKQPEDNLAPSKSLAPEEAQLRPTTNAPRFAWDDERFGALQTDVYICFEQAMEDRQDKLEDLKVYNDLWELTHQGEQNSPWVGASDIIPPTIPAEGEALSDYIIMAVYSPHLFLAKNPKPEEQKFLPAQERWLNALLFDERPDGVCWAEKLLGMVRASARDGTAHILQTWDHQERDVPVFSWIQDVDEQGNAKVSPDGSPAKKRIVKKTIHETINEPKLQIVLSRDLMLSPAIAKNVNTAAAAHVILYLMEEDLRAMADGMGSDPKYGTFSKDALEQVFAFNPNGTTDYTNTQQGIDDKDAGGQLSAGGGQGSMTSEFFQNRGPFEIVLTMSKQYDMNGDGRPEWNWIWHHHQSYTMIGWMNYEYLMRQWPIESFSMFPRIEQPDGYSVPERLADLVDQQTAQMNARINYDDMVVNPILLHKSGADSRNKDMTVIPGAVWEADSPADDYKWLSPPQSGSTSFQEDSRIDQLVAKIMGQAAPFTGGQSPTRQTAIQAKQASAAQSTRSAVIALWFKFFLRRFMAMTLSLYRQFADPETFNPDELQGQTKIDPQTGQETPVKPYEILMMGFKADVAGLSDPQDAATRRNDMAMWLDKITEKYPARFGQPEAQFEAVRTFTEVGFPNITGTETVLGTAEDAKKLGEQMRQMQAQQMQQQQQQGGGAPK
jgi:hypothetical protein